MISEILKEAKWIGKTNKFPIQSRAEKIDFDRKGVGSTPNQMDIDYFGFTIKMKPSDYLELNQRRSLDDRKESSEFLRNAIDAGKSICPPMLIVEWDQERNLWKTVGHEGRGRAMLAKEIMGDIPIEVDIKPQYLRRRSLTNEHLNAPIEADDESSNRNLKYQPKGIV